MAYYFYLGNMLLPVAPDKLTLKVNNNNKTYDLINEQEINVLKNPGLTDIEFKALLPNVKYPFLYVANGYLTLGNKALNSMSVNPGFLRTFISCSFIKS